MLLVAVYQVVYQHACVLAGSAVGAVELRRGGCVGDDALQWQAGSANFTLDLALVFRTSRISCLAMIVYRYLAISWQ